MSNIKDELIRLGSTNPELRTHLKKIIATLDGQETKREAAAKFQVPQSEAGQAYTFAFALYYDRGQTLFAEKYTDERGREKVTTLVLDGYDEDLEEELHKLGRKGIQNWGPRDVTRARNIIHQYVKYQQKNRKLKLVF